MRSTYGALNDFKSSVIRMESTFHMRPNDTSKRSGILSICHSMDAMDINSREEITSYLLDMFSYI